MTQEIASPVPATPAVPVEAASEAVVAFTEQARSRIAAISPLASAAALFGLAYFAVWASRFVPGLAVEAWWPRLMGGWACVASGLLFICVGRSHPMGSAARAGAIALAALTVFGITRLDLTHPLMLLTKDLAQLSLACLGGAYLARKIRDAELIMAISITATVTDLWSVTRGVTKALIDTQVLDYFLLNFPVFLRPETGYYIGTSDFILATVYIAFAESQGVSRWRAPLSMFLGMVTAGTLAFWLHKPLPVLPFMVPFFHLLFPRRTGLSRETMHLVVAGLAVIAVLAMLFS